MKSKNILLFVIFSILFSIAAVSLSGYLFKSSSKYWIEQDIIVPANLAYHYGIFTFVCSQHDTVSEHVYESFEIAYSYNLDSLKRAELNKAYVKFMGTNLWKKKEIQQ
jgi:hypothetical protein